jgi:outer membrane immunogenic protein
MKINKKILFFLIYLTTQNVFAKDLAGPYAGVEVNYTKAHDLGKEYDLDGSWNLWRQDIKPDGAGIGFNIGNNWILNDRFLLGVEANYKKNNARDTVFQYRVSDGLLCENDGADCTFKTKLDQSLSLIGKAGYLLNEKTVIYGLGGYTTAKLERRLYDGWDQMRWMEYNKWQNGWTLGAGLEYVFLKSLSLKAEYRFTDLGKYKYYTPAYEGQYIEQKYDQKEINLGINYFF